MTDDDLTPEQIRDRVTWLQEERRKGRERLAANASITTPKTKPLTDAESAAIARAKLEERTHP